MRTYPAAGSGSRSCLRSAADRRPLRSLRRMPIPARERRASARSEPVGMFLNADMVVKAVVGLVFGIGRHLDRMAAGQEHRTRDREAARRGAVRTSLTCGRWRKGGRALALRTGPIGPAAGAAVAEVALSAGSLEREGIKARIASRLNVSRPPTDAASFSAPECCNHRRQLPLSDCSARCGAS